MSFGGFTSKNSSGISDPGGGGGRKMVADGLCSYNIMSTGGLSQPQPKMENLGEMGLIRENYDTGLIGRTREDEFESSAFKDNPHPDEKGRLELGKRLGLENRQTQLERHENSILKQENDKLRIENIAMKEAMRSPMCENCGCPAILGEVPIEQHHLMIENARLKDELNRLGILATKFLGRPNGPMPPPQCRLDFGNKVSNAFPVMSGDVPFDKSMFLELALAGMDELIKLAQIDGPLWFRNLDGNGESLNLEEYTKTFSPFVGEKPSHFVTEATRATGTVIINGVTLVETLMDVNQWTEMFPWNIGRASILDVVSPGMAGNRNCALQLMQAEFQILSPLVPVRQMKFIRFCKQHGDDTWAVVDVSVDSLFHGMRGNAPVSCRRLPSGCIVQDMPNGYSKVTWIEHTEYDENIVHHLYRPLLRSGMAFGAQKWVANLQKQCELFAVLVPSMASNEDHSALPPSGKKSIVKLAQRMTRSFCTGVCATVHKWEVNEKTRGHWDVLSQDGPMQQMLRIPKGQDLGNNNICLLRTTFAAPNANQSSMLILQETCTDASGSLIVHAAVETSALTVAMNGGDSSAVAILPSGFAIVPDCFPDSSTLAHY
ncbi:hypothetical protein DH2020_030951 [Rehmannia glutinosa]|uniref:START domain-containing protein n=1 Tax=Rehmannia glutinosa TaxID=99300 RepID=A0ABR0VJD7_REHGL